MAHRKQIRLVSMRMWIQFLALLSGSGSGVAISCGVGGRCGSDPTFLWLWCRQAVLALIRLLAWELPYATGAALKSKKKKKVTRKITTSFKTLLLSQRNPSHFAGRIASLID